MRKSIILALAAIAVVSSAPVFAQTATPAPAQTAAGTASSSANAASSTAKYSTAETEIGILLDDPIAKAIVEKNIPGFTTDEQVDQARGMTLKQVQQYAPDSITDEVLAKIDADFAALPK